MTRTLLPHERPCDARGCEDGKVWEYVAGLECLVPCRECDGTAVLLNERRDNVWLRAFLDNTGAIYDRLRAYIHERDRLDLIVREKLDDAEAHVVRLQLENKSLRGQLHEKNREFDQLRKQHRDAMNLLDSAIPDHRKIAALDGAH